MFHWLVAPGILVGGFFFLFIINGIKIKMLRKSWGEFVSSKEGLKLSPGTFKEYPRVDGKYMGFPYKLETFTIYKEGRRQALNACCRMIIDLPADSGFKMHIYYEDFGQKVLRCLGMSQMEGYEKVDDFFMVKSNKPEILSNILTPKVREKLKARKKIINIYCYYNYIEFEMFQHMRNVDVLNDISDIICDIGSNISKEGNLKKHKKIAKTLERYKS